MTKFVPDISTKRWVIISPKRLGRKGDVHSKNKKVCVFCEGNEKLTSEEVMRSGKGKKDEKGWDVRVILNKYPITDIHEVVIHSPKCVQNFYHLSVKQIEKIFKVYRERFNTHRKSGQVIIFSNNGERAGASIKHSHSQIVVLPNQINIDTLIREPINNIIAENKYFTVYCPEFSQWPYEVWIAPKTTRKLFGDITDEEIRNLSKLLPKTIKKLKGIHKVEQVAQKEFNFNFYIHSKENWYLRIIPRFVHRAGFELGTGLSVNIVDPAQAAVDLK